MLTFAFIFFANICMLLMGTSSSPPLFLGYLLTVFNQLVIAELHFLCNLFLHLGKSILIIFFRPQEGVLLLFVVFSCPSIEVCACSNFLVCSRCRLGGYTTVKPDHKPVPAFLFKQAGADLSRWHIFLLISISQIFFLSFSIFGV